jgi:hypothetical protein
MLRGRGGCYKHAFYGIESHRCMEATPSLACANKCVFCWRHHSNPVATSWKWATDPAEQIVEQALAQHVAMVKEYSGVPGVLPARLQEGYQVGGVEGGVRLPAAWRCCACVGCLTGELLMAPAQSRLHGTVPPDRVDMSLMKVICAGFVYRHQCSCWPG